MGRLLKWVSRLVVFAVAIGCSSLLLQGRAAALTTQMRQDIFSKLCVVDVVQDGGPTTIQVPANDCESILPNLLTNLQQSPTENTEEQRISLPFAGLPEPATGLIIAQPGSSADQPWSPIASTAQSESGNGIIPASTRVTMTVAGSVGAVAFAAFVSADLVLFEFSHSMRALRWLRALITRT